MNPDIKTEWVAALRSGDFRQGRGRLKTANGEHCCLGVLCELAVKAGVAREIDGEYFGIHTDGRESVGYGDVPPAAVVEWAGLPHRDPGVNYEETTTLAYLNDGGSTFGDIADLIEAQL